MGGKSPPIGGPIKIPMDKDAKIRPKPAALWPWGNLSATYARHIDTDEIEPFRACMT